MNRRDVLKSGVVGAGALLLSGVRAQNADAPSTMARAARGYLEALGPKRASGGLPLSSATRTAWHWFPPTLYTEREGVTLSEMTVAQRTAALELLRVSTSETGYAKAQAIMATQRDLGRDPLEYHFTVFGDPTGNTWAWALEGHHLSLNYAVGNGRVTVAPIFLGASPTYQNNARRAVMRREEEAARELMRSLDANRRDKAIFDSDTPGDTVTRNATRVQPLAAVGIPVSELSSAQTALLLEVVTQYLSVLPPALAATRLEAVRASWHKPDFGWAGSLEPRKIHYYRLQGQSFLLEHDNSRESGAHIHSVWREFENDFGAGVL
ncbi:MAG: DUF3500 domain-containing protein [Pleurocapsa sp. SU_196_0]|nr:DUF3500 domain-containing protein [Pleurocapsa sp. SU_196_0]